MGATQSCHEGRKIVAGSQPRLSVVSPNDQWSRSSFARPNQPCVRPAAPSRRRVFRAALAHFSEQYRFARHGVNCLSQTGQVRLDAPAIDRKPSVSACGQGRGGRQRRPGAVERRTVACKRRNEQRGSFNRAHTTPPSSRLRTGCDRAGARQRATTFPSNCAGVDRSPSRQRTAAICALRSCTASRSPAHHATGFRPWRGSPLPAEAQAARMPREPHQRLGTARG